MVDGVFFFVSNRRKSACGKIQARRSPPLVQVLIEWFTIQPHSSQLSSTTARHQGAEETATNSLAMAKLLVSRSNKNTRTQSPCLHNKDQYPGEIRIKSKPETPIKGGKKKERKKGDLEEKTGRETEGKSETKKKTKKERNERKKKRGRKSRDRAEKRKIERERERERPGETENKKNKKNQRTEGETENKSFIQLAVHRDLRPKAICKTSKRA